MSNESIRKYTISELHSIALEDRHAVRDEVLRRHEKAARQLAKAQKLVEQLEALAKIVL